MKNYLFKEHLKETIFHIIYILWCIVLVFYNKHLNSYYSQYTDLVYQAYNVFKNELVVFSMVVLISLLMIAYYGLTAFRDIKLLYEDWSCINYHDVDVKQILIKIVLIVVLIILINNPILRILFGFVLMAMAILALIS